MGNTKLVSREQHNNTVQQSKIIMHQHQTQIEEFLNKFRKHIEDLEDRIEAIEYRITRHINTLDDLAHKA